MYGALAPHIESSVTLCAGHCHPIVGRAVPPHTQSNVTPHTGPCLPIHKAGSPHMQGRATPYTKLCHPIHSTQPPHIQDSASSVSLSRAMNPIYGEVPPHIQSNASLMYPHRAAPPHMDTTAPHVPRQLWGGQGAGPGAAAQQGVAPGRDWAHSGLGEIERNKQIRGQIPLGGDGRGGVESSRKAVG